MTESNYLTGAARFENGVLQELVIFCIDPLSPEMDEVGFMEQDYVASAEGVIGDIKAGAKFSARFDGSPKLYPLEVVTREGKETLEVADVGQPDQFKSLRNLPGIPTSEEQTWVLAFYEAFKELGQGQMGYLELSKVSWKSYAAHGGKDPAVAAVEVFRERQTGQ